MTTRQLFLLGAATFCATAILGQALPSMFPSKPPRIASGLPQNENEVRLFKIGAQSYHVTLAHDDIIDGPEWRPSMPLPLDFAKVEEIARAELRKLIPDDSHWEVMDLGLTRLQQTLRPEWYYLVTMRPKWDGAIVRPGFFSEIIALSGKPGKVEMDSISK